MRENLQSEYRTVPTIVAEHEQPPSTDAHHAVFELPADLFDTLEKAATAHPPQRVVNPSRSWGLGFDVFDEDWPF